LYSIPSGLTYKKAYESREIVLTFLITYISRFSLIISDFNIKNILYVLILTNEYSFR